MYAQIMFWNSYFRNFPSTEEPWGQAIWGLPVATGWPSFGLLWNLGWSRESCHYQPFVELLKKLVCRVSCRERDPVLEHTSPAHRCEYIWCQTGLCPSVHWSCQDILAWSSLSLLCFGRHAIIFTELAQIHTEYTESMYFNFCYTFALQCLTYNKLFCIRFLKAKIQFGNFS